MKSEKGPSAGFFPGFGPFEVDFLFFHRLQPVFHMIYPQLWKQLWINLRFCSFAVPFCYLLCR